MSILLTRGERTLGVLLMERVRARRVTVMVSEVIMTVDLQAFYLRSI